MAKCVQGWCILDVHVHCSAFERNFGQKWWTHPVPPSTLIFFDNVPMVVKRAKQQQKKNGQTLNEIPVNSTPVCIPAQKCSTLLQDLSSFLLLLLLMPNKTPCSVSIAPISVENRISRIGWQIFYFSLEVAPPTECPASPRFGIVGLFPEAKTKKKKAFSPESHERRKNVGISREAALRFPMD